MIPRLCVLTADGSHRKIRTGGVRSSSVQNASFGQAFGLVTNRHMSLSDSQKVYDCLAIDRIAGVGV